MEGRLHNFCDKRKFSVSLLHFSVYLPIFLSFSLSSLSLCTFFLSSFLPLPLTSSFPPFFLLLYLCLLSFFRFSLLFLRFFFFSFLPLFSICLCLLSLFLRSFSFSFSFSPFFPSFLPYLPSSSLPFFPL
jgi:hypothetical protein